jgi:uroporphyrinogen decarboxylase
MAGWTALFRASPPVAGAQYEELSEDEMNHRERVLAALDHRQTDRVPIDLGSTIVTTATRVAYQGLLAHLGLPPDDRPSISHRQMDTVYPREDLLERYDADCRAVCLKGPWEFEIRELPGDRFFDEYGLVWQKASYYYDVVERPFAAAERPSDLDALQWPDPYDAGRPAGVREEARRLYEETDYLVVADIMCLGPFEGACFMRGYDDFCTDLYWNPELAHAILDKITETDIALWDVFLRNVDGYVHVVAQGDDLGTQDRPWISPDMYRRMIKPYHTRLYDFIHARTDAKVFMHSCGSVFDLIPDLIDAGVQILNPLQRSAAKMDIATMKREFGRELCFWGGGIDVQQVLPFATLPEIEREVRHTIDVLGEDGGYVFCAAHNIQPDVSPDRFDAMYMSALSYRA